MLWEWWLLCLFLVSASVDDFEVVNGGDFGSEDSGNSSAEESSV